VKSYDPKVAKKASPREGMKGKKTMGDGTTGRQRVQRRTTSKGGQYPFYRGKTGSRAENARGYTGPAREVGGKDGQGDEALS